MRRNSVLSSGAGDEGSVAKRAKCLNIYVIHEVPEKVAALVKNWAEVVSWAKFEDVHLISGATIGAVNTTDDWYRPSFLLWSVKCHNTMYAWSLVHVTMGWCGLPWYYTTQPSSVKLIGMSQVLVNSREKNLRWWSVSLCPQMLYLDP